MTGHNVCFNRILIDIITTMKILKYRNRQISANIADSDSNLIKVNTVS